MPLLDLGDFYRICHSRRALLSELDGVLAAHRLTARMLPFYAHEHPAEWLPRYRAELVTNSGGTEDGGLWHFTRPWRNLPGSGSEPLRHGRFFIYDHDVYENVYVLVTVERWRFFEDLRALVERRYPATVTSFVKHRRMLRLLETFRSRYGLSRLRIARVSLGTRYGLDEQTGKDRIVPLVAWPNMTLEEAFQWVYEQNGWFRSLEFTAEPIGIKKARFGLTRRGVVRASAMFPQAFSAFVEPICELINDNVNLFGNRARRDSPTLSVKPLSIDFDTDGLREPAERRRFISAMRSLRTASVSVLHGNPYVHLSISDYYDGSVFDVWVLSSRQVTIVPQMKATYPAIKRLIHHVFDTYAEGHIREYEGLTA